MSRNRELLVGSVIIAAIVVSVVGTLWLQGSNFGRPMTEVEALSESAGQLSEGNTVTYRGVRIGYVSAIAVEAAGTAVRVSLLLQEQVTLPSDPVVILGPESLFGEWQAEIVSRSANPRLPFLEVGDAVPLVEGIPLFGGYALPELSRLTASAEGIALNLADLTDRLELAFNQETADNLASAIANIEDITRELRTLVEQQAGVAGSITASADSALAEVEIAARSARRSFERVETFVEDAQLDSLVSNLRAASVGVREVAEDLADEDSGLAATLERADSAFVKVDRVASRLESGEGSIGRLLTDSTFAFRAEEVLLQLDLLLQDIRENPRRYVRLSIF